MKILPVFLRNNIVNEFYIANYGSKKLVLEQLVCKDAKTFDITKCIVSINDEKVDFIKSNWATPTIFNVNGIPGNSAWYKMEPLAVVKFELQIICPKGDEEKYKEVRFHLHLSLEACAEENLFIESGFNLGAVG